MITKLVTTLQGNDNGLIDTRGNNTREPLSKKLWEEYHKQIEVLKLFVMIITLDLRGV